MQIVTVTPDSPWLAGWVGTSARALHAASDFATPYTELEMREELANTTGHQHCTAWAGLDGDRVVSAGLMMLPLTEDLHQAWVEVAVDPGHWGEGHGRQMLDHAVACASAEGRTTVLAESTAPLDDPEAPTRARRLLTRAGFSFADAEVQRVLDLPVGAAVLDRMQHDAAAHHEAYRLELFDHQMPARLAESYCTLANSLMTDSPTGDVEFEPGRMTPDHLQRRFESLGRQGRSMLICVALDGEGACVAHSELVVPGDVPDLVFQWNTLVRRDHRGHRLGLATKVANLRELQRRHPDRTSVRTWNSAANDPMIRVNDGMGFRPVESMVMWQRRA